MTVTYHVGDTRDVVRSLPDGSVSLVACSPPFIALRSYLPADHPDKHAEIGSEPDPATFLDTLLALTAEWGRVLAPWGSIAIELGDTYAGSGGENHLYEGSNPAAGFNGSAGQGALPGQKRRLNGWPRAKSLALIPQLYAGSLAYGRNLLTGQPSPAGQWLVRNVVTWHRPNPAVGALGDKVRPSTSYITVATRSAKRWFDLDAVRQPYLHPNHPQIGKSATGDKADHRGNWGTFPTRTEHPAGAPPLDCWFDEWDGSHDTWTLTTQPSRISITTTERVQCGPDDGGERTTSPDCPVHGDRPAPAPTESDGGPPGAHHSSRIPRNDDHRAPERDPADSCDGSRSSHSGQPTATPRNTASNRTAPAPSTSRPGTPSAQTAADTAHTPASPESSDAHHDTPESSSGEVCPPADGLETDTHTDRTPDPSSACTCTFHRTKSSVHSHYAMWPARLAERLILMMCPAQVCATCGTPRRRLSKATDEYQALLDGNNGGKGRVMVITDALVNPVGGTFPKGGDRRRTETLGWSDCGHGDYTPGTVLDPFAGTGTTLAVADLHDRDAIGIDIDERNRDLYPRRRDECARALFNVTRQLDGQQDLFGGVA